MIRIIPSYSNLLTSLDVVEDVSYYEFSSWMFFLSDVNTKVYTTRSTKINVVYQLTDFGTSTL